MKEVLQEVLKKIEQTQDVCSEIRSCNGSSLVMKSAKPKMQTAVPGLDSNLTVSGLVC